MSRGVWKFCGIKKSLGLKFIERFEIHNEAFERGEHAEEYKIAPLRWHGLNVASLFKQDEWRENYEAEPKE